MFVRFLTITALLDLTMTMATGLYIQADVQQRNDKGDHRLDEEAVRPGFIATCLLGLYGLVMLVSLLSLYLYHLNLIAINQTTNENMKGVRRSYFFPIRTARAPCGCLFRGSTNGSTHGSTRVGIRAAQPEPESPRLLLQLLAVVLQRGGGAFHAAPYA